jgi:hypothetical protein
MSAQDVLERYKKYLDSFTTEDLIQKLREAGINASLSEDGVGKIIFKNDIK